VSTIAEIESALPTLSADELRRVEEAVHQQYRERHGGIVCDDSYGVITEADLVASAESAFLAYDQEEKDHAQRQAR
jgi:hypothetical protein